MKLLSRRCVGRVPRLPRLACGALLAASLSLAGCATDEEVRREAHARAVHAAQVAAAQRRTSEPVLEDDGLPSQVPPPARRQSEPDDPREPFSPNYGRQAPPTPQRAAAVSPAPQTRRNSVTN